MAKQKRHFPVPPNAVYVWRGFMSPPPQTYANFAAFLGSVFVPACVLLQPQVGLRAYIPTLVPQQNKPTVVPDQTALMFWANPQAHDLANEALAVRIYQNLHGDAYDMQRSRLPEVPVALPSTATAFTAEQPYYLFDDTADWMPGKTLHAVGARPANITAAAFLTSVFEWATNFKNTPPKGIDGALVCCGNDYAVAWVHATAAVKNPAGLLDDFTRLIQLQLQIAPRAMSLPTGLWNKWPGLDLTLSKNTSLNIQFDRPVKTRPLK